MKHAVQPGVVMLRITDVMKLVALKKSTIYAEIQAGCFPKPVRLTKRCSAWVQSEVNDFIQARINESRGVEKGSV